MRVRLRLNRLQRLLAESRLSQNHWALKLGLSRGHWSDIVNGKHPYPSARTRQGILDAFAVDLEELFELEPGPIGGDTDFRRAIADRYLIDRELGQGGMGTIYLARDVRHGRVVAVKAVSAESVSGIGVAQFLRETATIAQLQHPSILTMLDSGEAAGQPYFVMPWVREGSLRERLVRRIRLTLDETVWLTQGICAALDRAHERRILHCDIKPENVLLDGNHPYVMDFGIARVIHTEALQWGRREGLDISAGTPAYVSPEQASGEPDLDPRSDVYSLGCMVFEMLAGRPAFQQPTAQATVARRFLGLVPDLREYAHDVPAPVAAVVAGAMALERDHRPAAAGRFAEQLDAAARGAPRRLTVATAGVSRAVSQARRALGLTPAHRLGGIMADLARDVVHAWRSLRRAPGFAILTVVTFALGIGVNATMFAVVDRLLVRPPPGVRDPGRIVTLSYRLSGPNAGVDRHSFSYPMYEAVRANAGTLGEVGVMTFPVDVPLGRGADARNALGQLVDAGFFAVLGVRPAMGRMIGANDEDSPVAVISHSLWQGHFAGSADAVGSVIDVGTQKLTIIGVTARGFIGLGLTPIDIWAPIAGAEGLRTQGPHWRTNHLTTWLRVLARVRDGVEPSDAAHEASAALGASLPPNLADATPRLLAVAIHRAERAFGEQEDTRVPLLVSAVSLLVLIVACVNIANLLVARAIRRRREISIRLSLGVGRFRLIRQLMLENLLLCGAGAAAACLMVHWGGAVVLATMFAGFGAPESLLDGRTVAYLVTITVVASALTALVPAVQASRLDLATALKSGAPQGGGRGAPGRSVLLVAQAAFSVLLLVGSGLFLKSLSSISRVPLGFDVSHLLIARVNPRALGLEPREVHRLFVSMEDRVRRTPGVAAASAVLTVPFWSTYYAGLSVPGVDSAALVALGGFSANAVSPTYFETMGSRLLRGRAFTVADNATAPRVAIIEEAMARRIWPQDDALGRCFRMGGDTMPCVTVIGLVERMVDNGIATDGAARKYFIPLEQAPARWTSRILLVRTTADPSRLVEPVRRAIQSAGSNLPYVDVMPLSQVPDFAAELRPWRLGSYMFGAFGLLALALSAVGLYGVIAQRVSEQYRELGVRVALGAAGGHLLAFVLAAALRPAVLGAIAGAGLALLLGPLIGPLLYQTSARDGTVFVASILTMVLTAAVAALGPAIRAARVDPLTAMKAE